MPIVTTSLSNNCLLLQNRERFSERISSVSDKLKSAGSGFGTARTSAFYGMETLSTSTTTAAAKDESVLKKASSTCCEFAIEHCQGQAAQLIKDAVFNLRAAKRAALSSASASASASSSSSSAVAAAKEGTAAVDGAAESKESAAEHMET
jgi:Cop9 signalosome subunit 5 C-terminal domain